MRIILSADDFNIRLTVRDDAGSRIGRPAGDFNPRSLSERITELGGELKISYPDGLNTQLMMVIPL